MAKKLDHTLDFLSPEEIQLLSISEPVEIGIYSMDWLRRDPRWTTDRLMDLKPSDGRETWDFDKGHV